MVQKVEKYAKQIVIDLRRKGLSYSEIKKTIFVPKSTLSSWLKKIKLTDEQKERLKKKRLDAAMAGAIKKNLKTEQAIEEIKKSSAEDIVKISNRELWLLGIMLYWKERLVYDNKNNLRKGVRFTNSNPYLIKLFLKWLKDIGKIKNDEIGFDIFVSKDKNAKTKSIVNHWSEITGFSKENFSRLYFQKIYTKRRGVKRRASKKSSFGQLRIRVRASSMLARQIAGWAKRIQDIVVKN
ncbi:MAG: hypothetical protein A2831_00300 [Candidatus Yanofskybacteria bacterium RIFCSPHIGHO2_01_FULL_44_17]|uniref:HTH psq-type domain-containing protein n=1 Tax=Candidatus Yanofskybacteria bacterium RIFCSPHIGHO2_01_FULL_44_17 TaxID=1802668 RepID=A0A1F8EW59_9BACT|nr:MAG: hypothetical protein A2831_00300 [Candidatus Yanofskybacteria bacterium RIFCSPHIGHO2_01_FULL_44_17]